MLTSIPGMSPRFAFGAALGTLAVAALVPLPASLFGEPTGQGPQSILSMLADRSPGARSSGVLLTTKKENSASSAHDLQPAKQRALGKIFSPEEQAAVPSGIGTVAIPGLLDEPIITTLGRVPDMAAPGGVDLLGGGEAPLTGGFSSPSPGGGGGGFIGGGGGGGAGGGGNPLDPIVAGPNNPDLAIVPNVPAVPEPETWAMMLLGMAACGAAMRRRRTIKLSVVGT